MIIAVVNQKGGVGKTTTTVNLGAALIEAGKTVLFVDLDSQGDLTSYANAFDKTSARIVKGDPKNPAESIRGEYDFVLLDCPPALGTEVAFALTQARVALIPLQTEYLALRGLKRLQETIEFARDPRRKGNPQLQTRIIFTMTDSRDPVAADIVQDVTRRFKNEVLPVVIKRSPLFASASVAHESILQHSPRSHGAGAYRALAEAMIQLQDKL